MTVRNLQDDASPGVELGGTTRTSTFNSETLDISEYDRWGVALDVSAAAGTTDIKVQTSYDGGTTWEDHYPRSVDSETQAAFAQITTSAIETSKFWDRMVPPEKPNAPHREGTTFQPRVRLVFTQASTPSITFTSARFIGLRYRS